MKNSEHEAGYPWSVKLTVEIEGRVGDDTGGDGGTKSGILATLKPEQAPDASDTETGDDIKVGVGAKLKNASEAASDS